MSDDELPSEEQLKLRKPEKRGLRSRNPNGLSSRRDREREEGRSRESRWGGREEEERERNPMDMVRGAHMDGDRNAPQGRDYQEAHPEYGRRDGTGGHGWEDRRSREDASGNGRRDEPDGRREDSRSGREETRLGREESKSSKSRDEGRGRQGGSRREEKASSSRRRSRSREKEKERVRSKERESSPYSKALDSWRKFKQAEKVALDQVPNLKSDSFQFFKHSKFKVATRREIFDKRPEDHPAYGEEWRIFWEKRWGLSCCGIGLIGCISQVQRATGSR